MIIKPAKIKKVEKLVTETISDPVYGCDFCSKKLTKNDWFNLSIFYPVDEYDEPDEKRNKEVDLCSWLCTFRYIKKIFTDNTNTARIDVITLPHLMYKDTESRNHNNKEFFKLIKND